VLVLAAVALPRLLSDDRQPTTDDRQPAVSGLPADRG
jgi:hypothetical protein